MTLASYLFGILAALITLFVVIEMLRRRRLRERHAVYWLIAGVLALIVGIFPQVLGWASQLVGVAVPTNLVFFVNIIILFFVCIQHASELTALETKTRVLAEELALQEIRLRTLEGKEEPPVGTKPETAEANPLEANPLEANPLEAK